MDTQLLQQLVITIALGLLIGAERERTQRKKKFKEFAGIRTFACISLFGFLSSVLGGLIHWSFTLVAFGMFLGLVIVLYIQSIQGRRVIGFTTELAAILTFTLGVVMYYDMFFAIIVGVLLSLLLALKEHIHKIVTYISDKEFYAILQFVIIAFVILPILPQETIDPWGAISPYTVWFTVVLISAIGFVGYFLTKFMGLERSSRLVGLLGGVASSTAVNVAFATDSKQATSKATISTLVSSNLLAIASSFLRIFFFVWVLHPPLFYYVLPYAGILMGCFLILSIGFRFLYGNISAKPAHFKLQNPLHIGGALKFAAFLIVILTLTSIAQLNLGTTGIYLTSLLSGLAKGDAIAIALATMTAEGTVSFSVALNGLLISLLSSLVAKLTVGRILGSKSYARHLALAYLIPALVIVGLLLLGTVR